ncbi:hypothetical protein DIPPA_10623 [Diplonema papillatum]|nr:hypothetical protein DIPPA_10623 [Diplonema papillatum]
MQRDEFYPRRSTSSGAPVSMHQLVRGKSRVAVACVVCALGLFIAGTATVAGKITGEVGGALSENCAPGTATSVTFATFDAKGITKGLWGNGLHGLVVWLVVFSLMWPFMCGLFQIAVWFAPLSRGIRSAVLILLKLTAHFAFVELVTVAIIASGLTLVVDRRVSSAELANIMSPVDTSRTSPAMHRGVEALEGCTDDPFGRLARSELDCASLLSSSDCETPLADLTAFPRSSTGHLSTHCPASCGRCQLAKLAAGESTPAIEAPSSSRVALVAASPVCEDDPTGSLAANGGSCIVLLNLLTCDDPMSKLRASAPGSLWMFCPVACDVCERWETAMEAGDLRVVGMAEVAPTAVPPTLSPTHSPGALVCKDDPTGSLAANGGSCPHLRGMLACDDPMSALQASAPGNLWMFCPLACKMCDKWETALAAGELKIVGMGEVVPTAAPPTLLASPSPGALVCKDDPTGSLAKNGVSCTVLSGLLACDDPMSNLDSSAPGNLWMLCPVACTVCGKWETALAAGELSIVGMGVAAPTIAPPGGLACKDDPTDSLAKSGVSCTVLSGLLACDDPMSVLQASSPGSLWMLCPVMCSVCEKWEAALAAGELSVVGMEVTPPPPMPTCNDDPLGIVTKQSSSCDELVMYDTACNAQDLRNRYSFSGETFSWMLCPKLCDACDRWASSVVAGDLAFLGITAESLEHWVPPPVQQTLPPVPPTCVDDPTLLMSSLESTACKAHENRQRCESNLTDLYPFAVGSSHAVPTWVVCPVTCGRCQDFMKASNAGLLAAVSITPTPGQPTHYVFFQVDVEAGEANYMMFLGTLCFIASAFWMHDTWRRTAMRCQSPSARGLRATVVLSCVAVVAFALIVLGLLLPAYRWEFTGSAASSLESPVVERSFVEIANELASRGGHHAFLAVVIYVLGIVVPVVLSATTVAVVLLPSGSSGTLRRVLSALLPFCMADALSYSLFIINDEVSKLVERAIVDELPCMYIPDPKTFLSVTASTKPAGPLLLVGSLLLYGTALSVLASDPPPAGRISIAPVELDEPDAREINFDIAKSSPLKLEERTDR